MVIKSIKMRMFCMYFFYDTLPVTDSIIDIRLKIGSSNEDMSWEGGANIRSNKSLVHCLVPVNSIRGHFI